MLLKAGFGSCIITKELSFPHTIPTSLATMAAHAQSTFVEDLGTISIGRRVVDHLIRGCVKNGKRGGFATKGLQCLINNLPSPCRKVSFHPFGRCEIDSRLGWPSFMIVSIRGRNEPDQHPGATSHFLAQQSIAWGNRILEKEQGRLLAEGLERSLWILQSIKKV